MVRALAITAFLTSAGCGTPVPPPPARTGPETAPAPRPVSAGPLERSKRDVAALQCEFFEKQCKAFYAKYGRAPLGLVELVAPDPAVAKPLIAGGADTLIDPWGKGQYQLEVRPEATFLVYCFEDGDPEKPVYSPTRSKANK